MYRGLDRSPLVRLLKAGVWMSLTCALAMLVVALFRWSAAGLTGQALLSAAGVFLACGAMYLMLRARVKAGPAMAMLLAGGVVASAICVVCLLALVWAGFAQHPGLWRLWWLTMIPAAAVALVTLVQLAGMRRGGAVEAVTGVMTAWAALMLMSLALRADTLAGLSAAYWWTLAFPAIVAAGGVLYVLAGRLLGTSRPGQASRTTAIALLILTHLAAALCAYEVGKAVCRADRPIRDAGDARDR